LSFVFRQYFLNALCFHQQTPFYEQIESQWFFADVAFVLNNYLFLPL